MISPLFVFIKQINIKTFFKILEIYITTNWNHYSLVAYDTPTICFEKNKSISKTNFFLNIGSNYYYYGFCNPLKLDFIVILGSWMTMDLLGYCNNEPTLLNKISGRLCHFNYVLFNPIKHFHWAIRNERQSFIAY